MRRLGTSIFVLSLTVSMVVAQEKTTEKAADKPETFASLKKEFEVAAQKYQAERTKAVQEAMKAAKEKREAAQKALAEAKTDEEKKAAQERLKEASQMPAMRINPADGPGAAFGPRFLEFAEKHPQDPEAFDSTMMALNVSGGPMSKNGLWERALKSLQENYATKPQIKKALKALTRTYDDAPAKLLREVVAQNPDREIQARACKALAQSYEISAQAGEFLQANTANRGNAESQLGKDRVALLIDNVEKNKKESEQWKQKLREKYSDVLPDLSVGKAAPEVAIKDVDGKPAKLSALKGKVVVLDIWATWCGPCRAMIPHEREMVERLKDKPFVLVSISADAKRETLTAFLAKEKMPWTHWWNGQEGGIVEDWDVQYFPTIYVLDAKGVIRHKDLRGEKLEEAINKLLKEMEATPNGG